MDRNNLITQLHSGIVKVSFLKNNGELRHMRCTLAANLIPLPPITETKRVRKENHDVCPVWDLDSSEWRSFRYDSVQLIEVED